MSTKNKYDMPENLTIQEQADWLFLNADLSQQAEIQRYLAKQQAQQEQAYKMSYTYSFVPAYGYSGSGTGTASSGDFYQSPQQHPVYYNELTGAYVQDKPQYTEDEKKLIEIIKWGQSKVNYLENIEAQFYHLHLKKMYVTFSDEDHAKLVEYVKSGRAPGYMSLLSNGSVLFMRYNGIFIVPYTKIQMGTIDWKAYVNEVEV